MLKLQELTVTIDNKQILEDINFNFEKGKIYAIMGPNGSGKSTLAYSIVGHPSYQTRKSKILLRNEKGKYEEITDLKADERARKGIFLSFQTPLSLSGIKVYQLLLMALNGKKDPLSVRKLVDEYAKELQIGEDLLSRSLNEGASGGERKKMEVLQAMVLDKKLMIFDEVDTGVDVDALKLISQFLKRHQKGKTFILITHYNRILHYLKPDQVLVMQQGRITKVGDYTLAEEIEKNGYNTHLLTS